MKTTWLADFIEKLGITFELANPALFRFLAAFLPYSTPIPVAVMTSKNASDFLGFDPWVAFVFVFGLEGMGLWFTSMFVDSIVKWIRSRNWKTFVIVALFGAVVSAYVYLLVSLNVTLEQASGSISAEYSRIITLLCFLPLLSGIGNGYYKLDLESKSKHDKDIEYQREAEERDKDRKSKERISKSAFKYGQPDPFSQPAQVYQQVAPVANQKKSDWRKLTPDEKHEVKYVLSIEDMLAKYDISRATAYAWKKNKV